MNAQQSIASAIVVLALVAGPVFGHGGVYQPPLPRPPGPLGEVPPGNGPFNPGSSPTGPTTPSSPGKLPGPSPGGQDGPGPVRGPLGPTGPTTPGGPVRPINPYRRLPTAKKVSPEHWTQWWYRNRTPLLELQARVAGNSVVTPSTRKVTVDAQLWREEALLTLIELLDHKSEDVSSAAAIALGKNGNHEAVAALIAVLDDRSRQAAVREAAALGLGLLGAGGSADQGRAVRGSLESVASSEKEATRLRGMAVYGLGLRGGVDSVPFLAEVLWAKSAAWDVPAAGATALGLVGGELAVEELIRAVGRPKTRAKRVSVRRAYAAHGLARAGDAAAVPALVEAGLDADIDVRRAAIMALGELADTKREDAIKLLTATLHRDKDRITRCLAAISLGRIAPDGARRSIEYLYSKGDNVEQPFAALALGLLARKLEDPSIVTGLHKDLVKRRNADLRGALCIALGLARHTDAAATLRAIVSERGDPDVRSHAAFAVGLLRDQGGAEALRSVFDKIADPALQREAAMALGLLGDRTAITLLVDKIASSDSIYIQGSAAVALGRIGGRESGEVLMKLLTDEKTSIQARAMAIVGMGLLLDQSEGVALKRIGADHDWFVQTAALQELTTIF